MATQETKEKGHSSFGDKFRGAAHVAHGLGEDIRGSLMSAVGSFGGTEESKAKDEEVVAKGRTEIEQGVAQMKGVAVHGGGTTAGPEHQAEAKTGDQPQQQPAKQEAPVPTPAVHGGGTTAGPEHQVEGKTGDQPQQQPAKQEAPGPTPTGPDPTEDLQSQQAQAKQVD